MSLLRAATSQPRISTVTSNLQWEKNEKKEEQSMSKTEYLQNLSLIMLEVCASSKRLLFLQTSARK